MHESTPGASQWPFGTSEMHGQVRAQDWAETPLGPIADWPTYLKCAVDFTLNAGFPSFLLWSTDLVQIYNDAYRRLCKGQQAPLGACYRLSSVDFGTHRAVLEQVWGGETIVLEESGFIPDPQRQDGSGAWLSISNSPVRDELGRVAGMSVTIIDSTQRVIAEAAVREKEEQLLKLLDLLPVGIGLLDAKGQAIHINPEGLELFGLPDPSAYQDIERTIFDRHGRQLAPDEFPSARALRGEVVNPEVDVLVVMNGRRRWLKAGAVPYFRDGKIDGCIGISHDVTEAKEAADRLEVLVAELQHRTRNLIGVVQALADRTLQGSASLDDFQPVFRERLNALARVQGMLSRLPEGLRVTFDELLRAELDAHAALDSGRVTLDGPAGVPLRSRMVQTLALALHELAANAVKHGALAQSAAHLAVSWRLEDRNGKSCLLIDWRESNVEMPDAGGARREGYGSELIERALPYQLKARTKLEFTPDGVHCSIELVVDMADAKDADHG